MLDYLKISQVQFQADFNPIKNSIQLEKLFKKALKFKPDIICTPECSNIITNDKKHLFKFADYQKNCPVLKMCTKFAKKNNLFISIGSLLLKKNNKKKLLNRSFLINNKGDIQTYYDKIHMFDVKISKSEIYKESELFHSGNKIIITKIKNINIGLTICYDLRFPNLYRSIAKKGAHIILIPAAFTVPTGRDHWKTLVRARAIENNLFIISTGMCGKHHGNRKTYGHSMIINPWGKILNKLDNNPNLLNTRINIQEVSEARKKIPSIFHD
tara:strand:+ start:1205 stop:2014 length:810 start_codon:yes stop_codon:yes gene_type:complete